jgi:ATP/maltotriose-dependent transcriptional regulator MalT
VPVAEAAQVIVDELEWSRATGARGHEGIQLIALGTLRAAEGRVAEGRRLVQEGEDLLADLGLLLISAGLVGEWVDLLCERPEEMERALVVAHETLAKAGETGVRSTVAADLADVVFAQGRTVEAERLLDGAKEIGASDDVVTRVIVARVRAKVLAGRGEAEAAERLAREAVERAFATEYVQLQADTLCALADVLTATDRLPEAAQVLTEAIRVYEAKGFIVLADRARARLAELQAVGSPSQ